MPVTIQKIVYEFTKDMHKLFEDDLNMVILYGSYARGDYNENSDIDLMILVKTPENQIPAYFDSVSDCAFEYLIKYGVDISPIIKNENHFRYWEETLPYYRNVRNEGVIFNA